MSEFPVENTPYGWESVAAEKEGRPVEPVCPRCRGLGVLLKEEPITGVYPQYAEVSQLVVTCRTCKPGERQKWIARYSGLESLEQTKTLMSWRIPQLKPEQQQQRVKAKGAIEDAIQTRTGLHTFWGSFGSGKTLALQICLNELRLNFSVEGYYAPLAGILDHLRGMYARKEETSTYWRRLLDIPVLALDECTRFHATDWARQQLFVLVDTRYRKRTSHLTLFATNDDPRQALPPSDELGYLYSRMREGTLIELRGDVRAAVTTATAHR